MEVATRALDISLTSENKKHIDTKCAAFARRFSEAMLLNLEIRKDRHHRKGDTIRMRASISLRTKNSALIHGESEEDTFLRALDEVLGALARQLERRKAPLRTRAAKSDE